MVWCSYEGNICLNPLCIGGCVSLASDRKYEIDAAKVIITAMQIAANKKEGE